MSLSNRFLSKNEIEHLTGYKQKAKQSEWLIGNGIHHFTDRIGLPKVLWSTLDTAEGTLSTRSKDVMPDFGALRELENGTQTAH